MGTLLGGAPHLRNCRSPLSRSLSSYKDRSDVPVSFAVRYPVHRCHQWLRSQPLGTVTADRMSKGGKNTQGFETLAHVVASAKPGSKGVHGNQGQPVRGLEIILRLVAESASEGSFSHQADGILSGLFRMALKMVEPPEPEVIKGPVRGIANAQHIIAAWPLIRALALLQLAHATSRLEHAEQALNILRDAGAAVLIQAMGDEGGKILHVLLGTFFAQMPDELRQDVQLSLVERPLHFGRYLPTGFQDNLRGFLKTSANRRKLDIVIRKSPSGPDNVGIDDHHVFEASPPEFGHSIESGVPSARTLWHYKNAKIDLSNPYAVHEEQEIRRQRSKHQRQDGFTARQAASAMGVPRTTFAEALQRAKNDGFVPSIREKDRQWLTAEDVKRLRPYLPKPKSRRRPK